MPMNNGHKIDALFKAALGVANSNPSKPFFEQPLLSAPIVFADAVWTEADAIPATAPALNPDETSGVVKRVVDLELSPVSGSSQAFTATGLRNIIPFNYGDGSYNYDIRGNGKQILFGQNNWVLQNNVLTFYDGMSGIELPLTISFYEYVGLKGVGTPGEGGGGTPTAISQILADLQVYGEQAVPGNQISTQQPFVPGSLRLYLDGGRCFEGNDYTVVNSTTVELDPEVFWEVDTDVRFDYVIAVDDTASSLRTALTDLQVYGETAVPGQEITSQHPFVPESLVLYLDGMRHFETRDFDILSATTIRLKDEVFWDAETNVKLDYLKA